MIGDSGVIGGGGECRPIGELLCCCGDMIVTEDEGGGDAVLLLSVTIAVDGNPLECSGSSSGTAVDGERCSSRRCMYSASASAATALAFVASIRALAATSSIAIASLECVVRSAIINRAIDC